MTYAPKPLDSLIRGGIGIFDASNDIEKLVTLLRFEDPAGMPEVDIKGSLDALLATGVNYPAKVNGPIGQASVFDPTLSVGLQAADLAVGGTTLPRDLTVQVLIAWDFAAQNTAATNGTIIARGLGTGVGEYQTFGVELRVIDVPSLTGEIRMFWQTAAGVTKSQVGASFIAPGAGNFILLTATRRWVSPTSVVVRYYANDQLLGEVASVDGDIAASVSGSTTIGTRLTAGVYGTFLAAQIEELAIFNYEMCREEIEALWLRLSLYQPDGYRQVKDAMQPGLPISDDPASDVQSDLRSMGVIAGFADATIENMRANMMPDRAYGPVLRRWEHITREPPRALDSLDTRRKRVNGHLASRGGVTPNAVTLALAPILDCQPSDLVVYAYDQTIRDTFAALNTTRWAVTADWDVIGNELRVAPAAGSYIWTPSNPSARSALVPVEGPRALSTPRPYLSAFAAMNPHTLPANGESGIVVWDWAGQSLFFFGVRNVAGSYKVGYQRWRFGVDTDAGAWTVLATTALQKHWLRVRPLSPQGLSSGLNTWHYEFSWSTVSHNEADMTTSASVTVASPIGWCGYYFRTPDGGAATAGAADVRFSEVAIRNELGTRPFYFYVYRNPALGGKPDFVGADRVLGRMKHAFTKACVVQSLDFLADDPGSVTDCQPTGLI